MKALIYLIGLIIGIGIGMCIEHNRKPEQIVSYITEQIVLTIPKDDKEAEKQLLYLAASKGMLEEIHRQGVLRSEKEAKGKKKTGSR